MSQIVVKFDNNIKQSDIIIPLTNSSRAEMGEYYKDNQPEIQQSKVYGIIAPLIAINGIAIDFDAVKEFNLKSTGPTPTLTMVVVDRFELMRTLDAPGSDNEIRIEILPRFDKIYKKINLTFYISNIKINGNIISVTGLYKLPKLYSSVFKSFGQISTYNLSETIAKETGLGFASNIEDSQDKRYIYCDNKSYNELMSREINHSGSDYIVLDWWVDFWNNMNLVDIYERYNSIDSDEDMKIWISGQLYEVQEDVEIEPSHVVANVNNHPIIKATELYSYKYDIKNKTGANVNQGTDKMYSIYSLNKNEYTDRLVQDGDIKKDIFVRHEYLGEVYGDYNYLISDKLRSAFLQKMNNETIDVYLPSPTLALMRGHKVNFAWYINDSIIDGKLSNLNDSHAVNNIQTNEFVGVDESYNSNEGGFKLDKQISGQYLIIGTGIRFTNNKWEYVLTLSRPSLNKQQLLKREE